MEWPEGWWAINPTIAAVFEAELARELAPGHPLFGLPVRAMGQGGNGDDVLLEVLDGSGRVASVHLTWARRAEAPPWPGSALFASRDEWLASENAAEAQ
jgi:hypothetical protein